MLLSGCKDLCFLRQTFCCWHFLNNIFPFFERIFSGVFFALETKLLSVKVQGWVTFPSSHPSLLNCCTFIVLSTATPGRKVSFT